jgi:hypothetical protein
MKQMRFNAKNDQLLQTVLERATAIVDRFLGFSFVGYTNGTKQIVTSRSAWLALPPHDSTQPVVPSISTMRLSSYQYINKSLYALGSNWAALGAVVEVEAAWGYGNVPLDLVEVTLEIAVNIWRSKDAARFTNVVFNEGSVGYEGALTPLQRQIIDKIKDDVLDRKQSGISEQIGILLL